MGRRIALVLTLLVLSGCGGSGDGPVEASLPTDRLELPEFDEDGYRALIAKLEGTPIVVNFWGSWCPPCEEEAPHLAEVSKEYEGRVQFLGVDILDAREPAREFIERYDWPYPSIFDPTAAIRDGLGYIGQPITLVYDAGGVLVWERVGTISAEDLRREIDRVL
jgi:thiol-disulfide isomerase/thioredoxin